MTRKHDPFSYLYQRVQGGIKPGLKNVSHALRILKKNHHSKTKYILVAGTNGKGSTAGWVFKKIYSRGHRVGLFTSPHMIEFRERFQCDSQLISNQQLFEVILRIKDTLGDQIFSNLTFFEVCTLIAIDWFDSLKTEYAILEVGMGGRLDSTNIVNPILSVVTSIDFDHQKWLGSTLPAIAQEKLGIARKNTPLLWAEPDTDKKKLQPCLEKISEAGTPVTLLKENHHHKNCMSRNKEIATQAVALLKLSGAVQIRDSPHPVSHLARGQILKTPFPQYINTCHNLAACQKMLQEIKQHINPNTCLAVFAPLNDKLYNEMISIANKSFSQLIGFRVQNERGVEKKHLSDQDIDWYNSCSEAHKKVTELQSHSENKTVVIFGSFLGIGEWLRQLNLSIDDLVESKEFE